MKTTQKLFILFFLVLVIKGVQAQQPVKIGLTGGAARFYPEAKFSSTSRNNMMDKGFGWSAGLFYEKCWKSIIHPIAELNYYSLSSDLFIEKAGYIPPSGNERPNHEYGIFPNSRFNYLSASAGVKLFLNKRLFVYPGFEVGRLLNRNVDLLSMMYYVKQNDWVPFYIETAYLDRMSYNLKLGAGVNLGFADVMFEYTSGQNKQISFFDYTKPYATIHRNKYIQLKVQVPLIKLNKKGL